MPLLVTNSAKKEFQSCRRRYRYKYVDCVRPQGSTALKVGTLCHVGFEWFWRGSTMAVILNAMRSSVRGDSWWDTEAGQVEFARSRALITGYYVAWSKTRDKWELVSCEETIIHSSSTVDIGIKTDVIARDTSSGELYLVEHKTTSEEISTIGDDYWLRLAIDGQITLYRHLVERKHSEPVKILYDVAKKIQGKPKMRERVVRRKDETDEELQARKDAARESIGEFEARLTKEAISNKGLYVRHEIHRTDEDTKRLLEEWAEVAEEMSVYKGVYPRNESFCQSRFGKCPYLGVCTGIESLDDPKFEQSEPHPELNLENYHGIDSRNCPL